MGVLIKDMEMPKNCADCPMYSRDDTCCILASYGCVDRYDYDCNKIPDWCPLSEAPEPCEDAVSRQAAIDAFPEIYRAWDTYDGYIAPHVIRRILSELPSAQPEIIRCKDCKHYFEEIHCDRVSWWNEANDFCSKAGREDSYEAD